MPRIARKDVKSPFLHIMVQGINKEYIFCNRNMLKELIGFLNKNCNIRYIEIKEFFDMTRGIIDGLKM